MENPVREILRMSGVSHAAFRRNWGMSKEGLAAALSGTYANLSPQLVEYLKQTAEFVGFIVDTDLSTKYNEWQAEERARVAYLLPQALPFRHDPKHSPAHFFMVDATGSREKFAKTFKLPRATLMRWDRGYTKGMPVVVEEALRQVKYPYVRELVEAHAAWVEENC